MGKIKKQDRFVDVELEVADLFQFNTPVLPDLYKFTWLILKMKAPNWAGQFNQAGRLLVVDGKLVGRFYQYMSEAQDDKRKADNG